MTRRRFDLTDFEWSIIQPLLPNKSRGMPRVDDRRVINGILWRFRTGSPWADVPERYGPYTTCYNRFVRWRKAGVWDYVLREVAKAFDGDIVMIDSSCVRVHQHARRWLHGTFPWRPDHKDSRRRRCRWQADRRRSDGRAGSRQPNGRAYVERHAQRHNPIGRQGL